MAHGSNGQSRLETEIERSLRHAGLTSCALVLAVSGGPDSLALLLAAERLRESLGLSLHVAHLDHGLRPDSHADAAYVRGVAKRLGIPVTIGREDIGEYRKQHRMSVEEAARTARYAFLGDVTRDVLAKAVLTAHTSDDQAETILLHLLRGTGLAGLRGMKPVTTLSLGDTVASVDIARPMLSVSRAETVAYCKSRRYRPREDVSNADRQFLRNRVRLDVIPVMKEARPGTREAILNMADVAGQAKDFVDTAATAALDSISRKMEDAIVLHTAGLLALHPAVRSAAIQLAAQRLVGEPPALEMTHVQAVDDLLRNQPGSSLDLPRGLRATLWYGEVVLSIGEPPCPLPTIEAGELSVPGETVRGGWQFKVATQKGGAVLHADFVEEGGAPADSFFPRTLTALLLPEHYAGGLSVRARRPGDRIGIFQRTRKVQDMLVDGKIPRGWRDRVPLVYQTDTGEPLWLVGLHNPKPLRQQVPVPSSEAPVTDSR